MRPVLRWVVIAELCAVIGIVAALGIVSYQRERRPAPPDPCVVTYVDHGELRTDFACR